MAGDFPRPCARHDHGNHTGHWLLANYAELLNRWNAGCFSRHSGQFIYPDQYPHPIQRINTANPISAGFERKSRDWSFIGNAYVPIGKINRKEQAFNQPFIIDVGLGNGLQNILLSPGFEKALYGADFEVGHTLPGISGLSAFLAGYVFGGTHLKALIGPRLRLEYELHGFKGEWMHFLLSSRGRKKAP